MLQRVQLLLLYQVRCWPDVCSKSGKHAGVPTKIQNNLSSSSGTKSLHLSVALSTVAIETTWRADILLLWWISTVSVMFTQFWLHRVTGDLRVLISADNADTIANFIRELCLPGRSMISPLPPTLSLKDVCLYFGFTLLYKLVQMCLCRWRPMLAKTSRLCSFASRPGLSAGFWLDFALIPAFSALCDLEYKSVPLPDTPSLSHSPRSGWDPWQCF